MLWGRPIECAWSLALVATGLPFYWFFRRRAAAAPRPASG
jgi:hypothetical protein